MSNTVASFACSCHLSIWPDLHDENLYTTEKAKAKVTYFAQDPLPPFQFVETTAAGELDRASIVSIVMNPTKEDDTVALGDDAYYCLLVDALDNGDTKTVSKLLEEDTEQDDDMQSGDDALPVTTRSGRRSARNKNSSDFVFY